jgi:hypothetical protein
MGFSFLICEFFFISEDVWPGTKIVVHYKLVFFYGSFLYTESTVKSIKVTVTGNTSFSGGTKRTKFFFLKEEKRNYQTMAEPSSIADKRDKWEKTVGPARNKACAAAKRKSSL